MIGTEIVAVVFHVSKDVVALLIAAELIRRNEQRLARTRHIVVKTVCPDCGCAHGKPDGLPHAAVPPELPIDPTHNNPAEPVTHGPPAG